MQFVTLKPFYAQSVVAKGYSRNYCLQKHLEEGPKEEHHVTTTVKKEAGDSSDPYALRDFYVPRNEKRNIKMIWVCISYYHIT